MDLVFKWNTNVFTNAIYFLKVLEKSSNCPCVMENKILEDAGKLSNGLLLKSMEFSDGKYSFCGDKCYFFKEIDEAISTLMPKFSNSRLPIDEIWPQFRNDILPLLILLGEHSARAEWNSEHIFRKIKQFLDVILISFCVRDLQQLFSYQDIASSIIDRIQDKLKNSCIIQYPAAIECFYWVTTNTKVVNFIILLIINWTWIFIPQIYNCFQIPSVEDYAAIALPISLNLWHNYENSLKQKGIGCIHHILLQSVSIKSKKFNLNTSNIIIFQHAEHIYTALLWLGWCYFWCFKKPPFPWWLKRYSESL